MTREGPKECSDIVSPLYILELVYIESDESRDEYLFLLGYQQCALYSLSREDFGFVNQRVT